VLCGRREAPPRGRRAFRKRASRSSRAAYTPASPRTPSGYVDSSSSAKPRTSGRRDRRRQNGRLKPRYKADALWRHAEPAGAVRLLDMSKFLYNIYPVQTTRGCPHGCQFCEVQALYGRKYATARWRSARRNQVAPRRNLHMWTTTSVATSVAPRNFPRHDPLKVHWSGSHTFKSIRDEEYVKLASSPAASTKPRH